MCTLKDIKYAYYARFLCMVDVIYTHVHSVLHFLCYIYYNITATGTSCIYKKCIISTPFHPLGPGILENLVFHSHLEDLFLPEGFYLVKVTNE